VREVRVKKSETIILVMILVCVFGLVFRAQLARSSINAQTVTPYAVDADPPIIEIPSQQPPVDIVAPGQDVIVWVNVTDSGSGVKNVTLSYTTNNGTSLETLIMVLNETVGFYETTIPGQQAETTVRYTITAFDKEENSATLNLTCTSCTYTVLPESLLVAYLLLFMATSAFAVVLAKKKMMLPG
jgi:hypothetical protein